MGRIILGGRNSLTGDLLRSTRELLLGDRPFELILRESDMDQKKLVSFLADLAPCRALVGLQVNMDIGGILPGIVRLLRATTSITTFGLIDVNMQTGAARTLAAALQANNSVTKLHIHDDLLVADAVRYFAEYAAQSTILQSISLTGRGNIICGILDKIAPGTVNKTLHSICLVGCTYCPRRWEVFSFALSRCRAVRSLRLMECSLDAMTAGSLTAALVASKIRELSLARNGFDEEGGAFFAASLVSASTSLESLDMSGNSLCSVRDLIEVLRDNKTLKSLCLRETGLGDDDAIMLRDLLTHNRTLVDIGLEDNDLGPAGAEAAAEIKRILRSRRARYRLRGVANAVRLLIGRHREILKPGGPVYSRAKRSFEDTAASQAKRAATSTD